MRAAPPCGSAADRRRARRRGRKTLSSSTSLHQLPSVRLDALFEHALHVQIVVDQVIPDLVDQEARAAREAPEVLAIVAAHRVEERDVPLVDRRARSARRSRSRRAAARSCRRSARSRRRRSAGSRRSARPGSRLPASAHPRRSPARSAKALRAARACRPPPRSRRRSTRTHRRAWRLRSRRARPRARTWSRNQTHAHGPCSHLPSRAGDSSRASTARARRPHARAYTRRRERHRCAAAPIARATAAQSSSSFLRPR